MICGIIVHPQWLRVLLLSERELDAALTGAASCPGAVLLFWGGLRGRISPQPDAQGELSCPRVPMLRVAISTIPGGPHKPPPQERHQPRTEGRASPRNLARTGALP